ncbi:MAG: hypothetical protein MZV64_19870 [Ignavibacteriales bacterium]|nr:hypothetical protein [Ignavibacteriales bacterium]
MTGIEPLQGYDDHRHRGAVRRPALQLRAKLPPETAGNRRRDVHAPVLGVFELRRQR